MLTRAEKEASVRELKEKFEKNSIAIFSSFHGLPVAKSQALRRELRKNDGEYKIAKKKLLDRALEEAGIHLTTDGMEGEVGVAFGYGDEVSSAKVLVKFGKGNETFKILGGILKGKILTDQDIKSLAKLPGREVLLAQLLRALQGPMRGLVTVLQGNMRNLVTVLDTIAKKK